MPRTSTKSKSLEKQVKEIVQMEIKEEVENKVCSLGYSSISLHPALGSGNVSASSNFFKLLPAFTQGDGKYNQRVGNTLRLYSLDIKGFLEYNPALTSDILPADKKIAVRVMILRSKDINAADKALTDIPSTQIRAGAPIAYNGNPLDSFRDINRDSFSVRHDEVVYMTAPFYSPGIPANTNDVVGRQSSLRMFNKKLTFGKNGLKLHFENAADTDPQNFPYYLCMCYSSMSFNAIPSSGVIHTTLQITGDYTDA